MAKDRPRKQRQAAEPVTEKAGAPDTYEALAEAAGNESLLGKMNRRFSEAIQTGRGSNYKVDARAEGRGDPGITADDIALSRARNTRLKKMLIPEGVLIEGSVTSGSETEIDGRVDGNVTVQGNVSLGPASIVSGSVQATRCIAHGLIEGGIQCSEELLLGEKSRLNANCMAAKRLIVQGQIFGNATCSGELRLTSTASVTGNIQARSVIIEEGAKFNGECAMRTPSERSK